LREAAKPKQNKAQRYRDGEACGILKNDVENMMTAICRR
jgi:hypothetical protein